jgi:hypothetical protein
VAVEAITRRVDGSTEMYGRREWTCVFR